MRSPEISTTRLPLPPRQVAGPLLPLSGSPLLLFSLLQPGTKGINGFRQIRAISYKIQLKVPVISIRNKRLPYFFGYKTEFFPSTTLQKI